MTDTPIAENEQIKELLALLRENKTPGYEDFLQMIDCVTAIEQRLQSAIGELEAIRQDIQNMQDGTLKSSLKGACRSLEATIAVMQQKLSELKNKLIEGCKHILSDFKQRGIAALNGIAQLLHLRPAFEAIRIGAENCEQQNNRAMAKIDAAAAEYHETGKHLKNMGRSLIGKNPVLETKENGKVAEAIKAPHRACRALMGEIQRASERASNALTKLEKKAERPSVLNNLRDQTEKKKTDRVSETPVKKTAQPER